MCLTLPSSHCKQVKAKGASSRSNRTTAQKRFQTAIDDAMKRGIAARNAEDEEEHEVALRRASDRGKIIAGMGPAGTGTAAIIHESIRKWTEKEGARVLFALPTGQLASRMRAEHTEIVGGGAADHDSVRHGHH